MTAMTSTPDTTATLVTSTMTTQSISLSPAVLGAMPIASFHLLSDAVAFVVRSIAFSDNGISVGQFDDDALDGALDQLEALFVQGAVRSTTLGFDDADASVMEARSLCVNAWVCPTSGLFWSVADAACQVECAALGIALDDETTMYDEEGLYLPGLYAVCRDVAA